MVALLGLKSLFGQTSSLLLKQCPCIYNLRLYDDTDISVAHDLSIIHTQCKVEAYQGKNNLTKAVRGSDIVLIGDDFLSTPLTSFDIMAPKMQEYAKAIAESSPHAIVIVAASPVNKLVPVLSELLSENGIHDCNKLIGTTAVNNVRANCMLASYVHSDPRNVFLPVVGGDSEETIVPLFSQAKPFFNLSEVVMRRLIDEIRKAQTVIYEIKGKTEALNKSYSTIKFLKSVIAGLKGEPNIMSIAFTKTAQVDGTDYFALPVLLGRFGVQARFGIPKLSSFESDLINESVFNINKDVEYAKLFCKSRDTAIEFCNRNLANRFKKSKEFEKFVNDLKTNKKLDKSEDKLINKLKPPLPIESGRLPTKPADKPFDAMKLCLKHKYTTSRKKSIIPPYMKSGASIVPSLPYTFPKYNIDAARESKHFIGQTPICEPIQCHVQQKETSLNMSNIVSLVENIVRKTTDKIITEMEKEKNKKISNETTPLVNKYEEKVSQDVKVKLGKENNLNDSKYKVNSCRSKESNSYHMFENFNRKDCKISCKNKYSETKLESIFRPSINSFQKINEYMLGLGRLGENMHPKKVGPNKHASDITLKKNDILNEPQITKSFYDSELECNKHKNDSDNLPIRKSFELKSKQGCTNEFLNLNEEKHSNVKSGRINRILNLLNDTTPKQSVCLKSHSEQYDKAGYRKAISPEKPVFYDISELSQKNIQHLEVKKEDKICLPQREIKLDNLYVTNKKSIKQNTKLEPSEKNINEKSITDPTKDKKYNYFNQRYKFRKTFSKMLINKNGMPKTKTFNDITAKQTVIEKQTEFVENKKSEAIEPFIKEKSTKNLIKNSYKTQNSINCKSIDELLNIQIYKSSVNQFKESKDDRISTENNVNTPINNICYNSSKNEFKKVNDNALSFSDCHDDVINNIAKTIENKPLSSKLNDLDSTTNHKNNDLTLDLETSTGTQTEINGRHLSIMLEMLDNDVFKCNNILKTSKTSEDSEEKADENKLNEKKSLLCNQQNSIEDTLAPSMDHIVHEENKKILSKNKDQIALVEDTYQPKLENEIVKPSEIKFDGNCDEKNTISQLADKHCNLTTLFLNKDQILLPEVKSQSLEIPNKNHLSQFPQNHFATTGKNSHHNMFSESKKYKSYSEHYKPKIISPTEKYSGSNKNEDLKPLSQQKYSCCAKSPKLNNNNNDSNKVKVKSSYTISKINGANRCNEEIMKPKFNENGCTNSKDSLIKSDNSNELHYFGDKFGKTTLIGNSLKKRKSSVKSVKQISYDTKENNELPLSKTRVLKNYGSKNKLSDTSKMNQSFNAEILNTLNEINKSEHSFRIKDKNGINNFFLLKGLLPQIENIEISHKSPISGNKQENTSNLKKKIYNKAPFTAIQHKMPSKIIKDDIKLLQLKKNNRGCYTTSEEDNGKDSLFITHNYVYSPQCPVHSYKYFLDKNKLKSKTNLKKKYGKPSLEDNTVFSNLSKISNKISANKRNSSHLSQKAPYFKPYSTSTQSRHKSPSRLLFNSKNTPYCLADKDLKPRTTVVKKPNGYIQKQRIAKVLEQGIKKRSLFPHKSNVLTNTPNSNTESNASVKRDGFKLKLMNKAQTQYLTGPFTPHHSEDSKRSVKITEKFYNSSLGTSYALRSLNNPPNWEPCQHPMISFSNDSNKKNEKPSITRMKNQSFNINWSLLHNKNQNFYSSSNSRENDILGRGTCLEHVKNNFSVNVSRFIGNHDVSDNQEKNVNSIGSTYISDAYTQYTKESTINEYSKSHKIPSIRQLHKNAFGPS